MYSSTWAQIFCLFFFVCTIRENQCLCWSWYELWIKSLGLWLMLLNFVLSWICFDVFLFTLSTRLSTILLFCCRRKAFSSLSCNNNLFKFKHSLIKSSFFLLQNLSSLYVPLSLFQKSCGLFVCLKSACDWFLWLLFLFDNYFQYW